MDFTAQVCLSDNSVQCSWDDLNIIYFSNYESFVILLPISMKLLLII